MKKKFSSIGKKTLALTLAFVLTFGVYVGSTSILAEEEVPVLTKEMFIENILTDNLVIIDLEEQLVQLNDQLDSWPSTISGLQTIYALVPEYNRIGNKILYTSDNQPRLLEILFDMVIANPVVPPAVHPLAEEFGSILAGLSGDELVKLMIDPTDYAIYNAYGNALAFVGITSTTVSADQEYETFILPIYVGTRSLQSGIKSLEDGIDSAKGGITVGAKQLYNTVLMLTDLLDILNLSYETSVTNYNSTLEKHSQGLVSDITLKKSYNSMVTAELNRNKMIRDIDDLKMNMSVMMGKSPSYLFTLESAQTSTVELETVNTYINEALVQRSEIISLNRSIEDQRYKKIFVGDIYSKSDNRYIIEEKQLEFYEIQLEETQDDITVEVYKAYNDVREKELALELANLEVEDAYRQYSELAINVELGFVTESTLSNLNLLVTSAVNDASTASRNYLSAVESLLDGSSFGPGSSTEGGTGIE